MKLGSRLLLSLLPAVLVVMTGFATWSLVERERTLVPAAQRETQAYALALGLALEVAGSDLHGERAQSIIDQVGREPSVYGIILYDTSGAQVLASLYDSTGRRILAAVPVRQSDAPDTATMVRVLRDGKVVTFQRAIDDQRVLSVMRPVFDRRGKVSGALEVAQPLDFIEFQQAQIRRRFLINTLVLVGVVSTLTLLLVHRLVARPMQALVLDAGALGAGHLGHRVSTTGPGVELTTLASALNGMAANLEAAQVQLVTEAEERVGLERRLRESEKLATIGNLAAGLAHEVAAPLNVIQGRAELLRERTTSGSDEARQVEIIIRQIGRITRTVQNLLGFARRRVMAARPLDLVEVLDGALELLEGEFTRAGITVHRRIDGPAPMTGDPDLLHDAFVNLLVNAIQAMEAVDGPRVITTRLLPETPGADGAWRILEFQDSGPGIPEGFFPQLFEPYATTKPRGTGLGLALVRSIIQEHGGTIDARNDADHGAIFRISLPASSRVPHA